ncbi:uncharacterized protein K452DRAFT_93463 [Aplosporella prunicola CBS 121167]|uniref:Uncharacterized protein n=1 Tax=Aplosporella prunicola CBS 121167 TaxID=1176127 RepID=A0A6A6B1D1_9PEZI|nr:uncharacterized protein K452DRAFT_93463 [Aplosporella prunicola CBS 121167]KAF2137979.1 hypothetical protein K452DRAFT_93463 [Aplosporella prunicola CBS 121167]
MGRVALGMRLSICFFFSLSFRLRTHLLPSFRLSSRYGPSFAILPLSTSWLACLHTSLHAYFDMAFSHPIVSSTRLSHTLPLYCPAFSFLDPP